MAHEGHGKSKIVHQWWGTDGKSSQAKSVPVRSKSDMYVLCKTHPFQLQEGARVCRLSAVSARTRDCERVCVPRRAALGLCCYSWTCAGTRCALGAGCAQRSPSLARTRTLSNSLVWSSHPCYQARGFGGGNGIRRWAAPLQSECDSEDRQAQGRVLCTCGTGSQPPGLMYPQP